MRALEHAARLHERSSESHIVFEASMSTDLSNIFFPL